jgi:hypothetical protein
MTLRSEEEDLLTRYYLTQAGRGSEVFSGQLYQKGRNKHKKGVVHTII